MSEPHKTFPFIYSPSSGLRMVSFSGPYLVLLDAHWSDPLSKTTDHVPSKSTDDVIRPLYKSVVSTVHHQFTLSSCP